MKKPHIRIDANEIPSVLINFLKKTYGENEVEIIFDPDEEIIRVKDSGWYQKAKKDIKPQDTVRFYRKLNGWTLAELGQKIGGMNRQEVYQIEKGKRGISKKTALELAKIFNISVERLLK